MIAAIYTPDGLIKKNRDTSLDKIATHLFIEAVVRVTFLYRNRLFSMLIQIRNFAAKLGMSSAYLTPSEL